MDTDRRVLVNPNKAIRCGWCGSYESEKWHHDNIRSSVWCSRSCYWAGHFGNFVCVTAAMLVIDIFLVIFEFGSIEPPLPSTMFLFIFLFTLTGLSAVVSYVAYSNGQKIPKRED